MVDLNDKHRFKQINGDWLIAYARDRGNGLFDHASQCLFYENMLRGRILIHPDQLTKYQEYLATQRAKSS